MKRKTLIYLPILILLGLGVLLLGAWDMQGAAAAPVPEEWLQAADAPTPVLFYGFTQCADEPDVFYVLGSYPGQTYFYRYDASNNVWISLPNFPMPIERSALVCYQDKIYAAGGDNGPGAIDTLYIYDITDGYWMQGPNMPHVLKQAAAGVWDGKIYVAGGTMTSVPWPPIDHVDIFDIASGAWADHAGMPMPVPASSPGYAQVGQYLYIVGGFSGDFAHNVNATQRYDMATGMWESGPEFTSARAAFDLVATGTHLYAIGGDADGGTQFDPTSLVEALDLSAWPGGSWVDIVDPLPMPIEGNSGFCSESVSGGEIWSIGGVDAGQNYLDDAFYRSTGEPCADFYFGDLLREEITLGNHPGGVAHFVLPVYNAGTETDTFDVTASGTWTVTTPADTGLIVPGATYLLMVEVEIPSGALPGDTDTTVVTITSQADPLMQDTATLTTLADGWQEAASMDVGVGFHDIARCVEDPGGFYVIGGARPNLVPADDIWHYDSVSDSWSFVTNLPVGGWGKATTCYQGKLYVAGGAYTQRFDVYDLLMHTWTQLQTPPRQFFGAAMGAWDGKLYVAGGDAWTGVFEPTNQVDVYDIASNTWGSGPVMPTASEAYGAVQVGPYLYVVGGLSGNWYQNLDITLRLNMAAGSWESGPAFTSRRAMPALGITEGHLYAMGGDQNGFDRLEPSGMVEVLDLSQWRDGTWQEIPQPIPWPLEANWGGACTQGRSGGEVWSVGGAYGVWGNYGVIDNAYYLPVGEPCVHYGVELLAPDDGWGTIGGTVEYDLTITNTGTITDYYELTVETTWPGGLIAGVSQGGPGPVGPGESITTIIEVVIPADVQPGDQGVSEITVASISDPTAMATAQIITTAYGHGVAVYPESDEKLGEAGETLEYTLTVTNTGSVGDEFAIAVTGNTWTTTVPATTGWLEPGDVLEIPVTVEIPPDAPPGAEDVALLTFTSVGDPEVSASATLTSGTYSYGVDVDPESAEMIGMPGDTLTYTLVVTNTGDAGDMYSIVISGNLWTTEAPTMTIWLESGITTTVQVVVSIPLEAVAGEWDVAVLTFTSQHDPEQYDTATLTSRVPVWFTYLPMVWK